MIYSEFRFTLDIRALTSQVSLGVKKGETGRRLRIHLTENGYPYHIPDNCYAVFTAKKPDGNKIFNDCVIQDCEIFYDVTEQTVSTTGLLPCAINLYGVEGELLISATFQMIVYSAPVDQSDIESTAEYKALATLIAEAQALKDDMEDGGPGGYYLPTVEQVDDTTLRISFAPSSEEMPAVDPVEVKLPEYSGDDSTQNTTLTAAQIEALHGMFKVCAYDESADYAGAYAAFQNAFGLTSGGNDGEDSSGTGESYAFGEVWQENSFNLVAGNISSDGGETPLVTATLTQQGYVCTTKVFEKDTAVRITLVPDANIWNQSFIGCARVDEWQKVVANTTSDVYLHYAVKTDSQLLVDTEYSYTYTVKAGYQLVMTFGGKITTVPGIGVVA